MLKQTRQNTNTNRFKTKIYLEGINPPKNVENLKQFIVKTEIKTMLYSEEGIFSLENDKIVKMKPIDKAVTRIDNLIFDDSYFEKEIVFSQIPSDSVVDSFTRKYYSLNKRYNTLLQLVIDERNHIPTNFYFFLNDAYFFENILVKKELNGFLSMLN